MSTANRDKAQSNPKRRQSPATLYKLHPKVGRPMMARDLGPRIGYLKLGDLVDNFQPEALDRLFGSSNWARLSFNAGDPVYPLEWCDSALLNVQAGSVEILLDKGGERLPIKQIGPDAVFGEMPPLGARMFGAVAEAAETSSIIAVSKAGIASAIARSPRFLRAWARMAGLRVFDLEGFCVVATFGSPIARVAYDVLSRAGEDGTVRATHQQIADRLGAGRLVVSRALRELERSGAVSMRRGRIVIESRDLLKKFTLF